VTGAVAGAAGAGATVVAWVVDSAGFEMPRRTLSRDGRAGRLLRSGRVAVTLAVGVKVSGVETVCGVAVAASTEMAVVVLTASCTAAMPSPVVVMSMSVVSVTATILILRFMDPPGAGRGSSRYAGDVRLPPSSG